MSRARQTRSTAALAVGAELLRAALPVPWPCVVTLGPAGRGWQGWAEVTDDGAEVRVSDRAGPVSALATLAHEWAHLLAWADPSAGSQPDHGPRWRELHAEVRRVLGIAR